MKLLRQRKEKINRNVEENKLFISNHFSYRVAFHGKEPVVSFLLHWKKSGSTLHCWLVNSGTQSQVNAPYYQKENSHLLLPPSV